MYLLELKNIYKKILSYRKTTRLSTIFLKKKMIEDLWLGILFLNRGYFIFLLKWSFRFGGGGVLSGLFNFVLSKFFFKSLFAFKFYTLEWILKIEKGDDLYFFV